MRPLEQPIFTHGTKSYARLRPSAGFHAASCRAACRHVSTPEARVVTLVVTVSFVGKRSQEILEDLGSHYIYNIYYIYITYIYIYVYLLYISEEPREFA